MAKIVIGIVAAIACLALVESLDCNKCSVGLLGFCLNTATATCSANTSVCYTSKATFSAISSFKGFSSQGCSETDTCGPTNSTTTNGTLPLLGLVYEVNTQCCTKDKCNTVSLSGATPTTTLSLSVLSAAALLAMCGSFM